MPEEKKFSNNKIFNFRVKKNASEYAGGASETKRPVTNQVMEEIIVEPGKPEKSSTAENPFSFEPSRGPKEVIKAKVTKEEPGFADKALSAAGTFLTKPLYQSDEILGEAGEEFKKAFTKQSTGAVGTDIEKGLSHLAGGVGKTIEAPIAALLGYVNQVVEPIATAAAESKVGKAIDETPTAQFINQLLTKPATTAMQGLEDLTGLEKPDEGFLMLGDLFANLLGFKAVEGAIFPKAPNLSPYGKVKVSKARMKELKSEAKNVKTSEIPVEQGKSAVKQPKVETQKGTTQPKGPDQKVTPEAAYTKDQITGLKAKTLGQMSEKITLNSPKLGRFRNESMGTVEVFKQLKEKGLFEEAQKIAEDLTRGSKFDVVKGATLETVARVMLKEAEALKGKVTEAPKPKTKPKPIIDQIVETPVAELPKGISEKVISVAEEFKNEIESATVTRKQAYGNEYLGIGQTKSFTINDFPDWYRRIGRERKDIIEALDKIIDGKVTEKGKLIQDLKAEIYNRLAGKHEETIVTVHSGKKKVERMGEIPGDPKFEAFIKKQGKDLSLEEMAAAWDKFSEGWKKFEEQTSFKPGVDFEAGPEVKFATPVKKLTDYQKFKAGLKDRKYTTDELVDELMQLQQLRDKQNINRYELAQMKDVAKQLSEQSGKEIIVDAKNVYFPEGTKTTAVEPKSLIKDADQLKSYLKEKPKTEEVKMTAEGAARKAAAEGKEAPKVEAKPKSIEEIFKVDESKGTKEQIAEQRKQAEQVDTWYRGDQIPDRPLEEGMFLAPSKEIAAEWGGKYITEVKVKHGPGVEINTFAVGKGNKLDYPSLRIKDLSKVKGPKTLKPEPKPKQTIAEAMREQKGFTVESIAEATGAAKIDIAKDIQNLKASKLVKEVVKDNKKQYVATDEFNVLLDDMISNPKVYDTSLNKLYSNPIGPMLKGIDKAITFLDDAFQKMLGDRIYKTLGKGLEKITPEIIKEQIITNYGLPKKYLELRQYAKDAIERYNELATEIGDNLLWKDKEAGVKFTKAEQQRLAQVIKGSVTKNPVFKERATKAINEIKQLEKLGKELEVLPIETYNTKLPRKRIAELLNKKHNLQAAAEKIKDLDKNRYIQLQRQIGELEKRVQTSFKHGGEGYFKRVYLSKEQQANFARYGYYRPTRLDLTSALHRKDIPFEIRKQMGEVLEASYPVSKGILLEGKDVSLGNFFKAISEHPDWVSTVEREGFVKMPKSKKLGKLSEMFVEERIAADINDVIKLTDPENFDAFLKGVNSIWKATKTIMNPSTHMRNVMSNSVMMDFSGVSHVNQARILPEAIRAIRGKGQYAREFKASRLSNTTFAKEELMKYLDVIEQSGGLSNWKNLTLAEKAKKLFSSDAFLKGYGKVTGVDTRLGKFLGEMYQMEETVFKAIKFIAEREKGRSIAEARAQANKWLFDYGEIPKAVRFLRSNPLIGKPFVTWSYKAFPRIIESAITRPVSFWKYPVIFSALTKYALDKLDMTEEEWERLKADFPDRLAKGEWLLLPFRDENGKMQQLDLTYILPYKDVYDVAMNGYALATTGEMEQGKNIAESVMNMIDAPVTTMISEIQSNKNSYTGFPIYSTADTPGEKYAKVADYLYKLYMPSLVPEIPGVSQGGYSYHKLASTISGKEDYYGRNFTFGPAFMSAFMGVKTSPIDPEKNRERKYYKLNAELMEFSKKRSRIKKDPTLSNKEKAEKIRDIEIEMQRLKAEQQKTGFKP